MKSFEKKKMHNNNTSDKKISVALMSYFVILTFQYLLLLYFNLLESGIALIIQSVSKGLVGLSFAFALPLVLKRNKSKFFLVYFIAISIFLWHYAFFPNNRPYMNDLFFPLFFMNLPAFLYALSIQNFSEFKFYMKKTSYIVFVLGVFLGYLVFSGKSSIGAYSISLSYYMLLPTIMFLDDFVDKFTLKMLSFSVISFIVIISLGSRGAVLCIFVFLVLKIIRRIFEKNYKHFLENYIFLGLFVFALVFFDKVVMNIYTWFLKFGINSRTLLLFLDKKVHLSGREYFYNDVLVELFKQPIKGLGVFGDRKILGGSYVHNFFIEIFSDFGIILGILIGTCLILIILKSMFVKNKGEFNIVIIWVSLGFVHLIVSSSYLIDVKFWIFLGLIINISFFGKGRVSNE